MSQENAEYLYCRYYNGYRLIVREVASARELAMMCAIESAEDDSTLNSLYEMCDYMKIKIKNNDSKTNEKNKRRCSGTADKVSRIQR
jgi:hypothetical protein